MGAIRTFHQPLRQRQAEALQPFFTVLFPVAFSQGTEDRYETNGAARLVCGSESGIVATMEARTVVERNRASPGQACWFDSWRVVIDKGRHAGRSAAITRGIDVGGARRNFPGADQRRVHPANRPYTQTRTVDGQPRNSPLWRRAHLSHCRGRHARLSSHAAPEAVSARHLTDAPETRRE